MKVSAQYARTHFDELLETVYRGEEIEIVGDDRPIAKIIVMPAPLPPAPKGERKLGMGRGKLLLSDEDWQRMKEEDEQYYANLPLMTSGEL